MNQQTCLDLGYRILFNRVYFNHYSITIFKSGKRYTQAIPADDFTDSRISETIDFMIANFEQNSVEDKTPNKTDL